MNYKFLLYSILLAVLSFAYYKFNIWWINVRKEKAEGFYKPDTYIGIVRNWIIIIGLALASLFYLLEAIG
jgi:hypothetical protein